MRDYVPIILILCGLIALETYGWLRTLYKQWQYEQMRRQKPLGSEQRHIDLRG